MLTNPLDSELAELRAVAEERGHFLEITNSALKRLSVEADRRKELADELQRIAAERLSSIERLERANQELTAVAGERLAEHVHRFEEPGALADEIYG